MKVAYKRDFRKEYDTYAGKPEQIKRRASRNKARAEAVKAGKVTKGDGREVDHINAPRKGSLDKVKTRVMSKKLNRSLQPARGGKK